MGHWAASPLAPLRAKSICSNRDNEALSGSIDNGARFEAVTVRDAGHGDPPSEINGGRFAAARRFLRALGPGIITGAADDDPSGIATYSIAGAKFGTGLLWMALLSWRSWPPFRPCARGSGW